MSEKELWDRIYQLEAELASLKTREIPTHPYISGDMNLESPNPTLTVGDGSGTPTIALDGTATSRSLNFNTGGVARWIIRAEDAESSGDAGSNLAIMSRHDDGTFISRVLDLIRSSGLATFSNDVKVTGDLYTVVYTDYSATSTIVGWSSFTNKFIFYKKIGKLVFVEFYLSGTSNSITTTFTLPYNKAAGMQVYLPVLVQDNGTNQMGAITLPASGSTITCYSNVGFAGWTASGAKAVRGQMIYASA